MINVTLNVNKLIEMDMKEMAEHNDFIIEAVYYELDLGKMQKEVKLDQDLDIIMFFPELTRFVFSSLCWKDIFSEEDINLIESSQEHRIYHSCMLTIDNFDEVVLALKEYQAIINL